MKNLKVATRLYIGFGGLMALLLIIAFLGFYGMSSLYGNLDTIAHINNPEGRLANRLQTSVTTRALALRNLALLNDQASMAKEAARIRKQEKVYAEAYAELGKMFAQPETTARERQLYSRLKDDEAVATPGLRKAEAQGLANDMTSATKVLLEEVRPKQLAWLADLAELAQLEEEQNAQAGDEAASAYTTVRTIVGCAAAIALVLAAIAAVATTRSILWQLGGEPAEAQETARQIASGNLAVPVRAEVGDSSSMMASLEAMRQQLSSVVRGIKASAESIAVASSEIAQGNIELSQRTEEQAASLEETAASLEELTSTVRLNTQNAQQGSTLASNASEAAEAGGNVVSRVVATMQDISESSSKMAEIITVIEGIAFQTNILALNAAVEAARAGEQGRGFAVVAGEVRSLAQRAATAAKEIKTLISTSVEHVVTGSALVQSAGQTIGEVVRSVKRVTDTMGEIASASSEQSKGIEQVNVAVSQMDEATQRNAALVEQTAAAAQAMADQADNLRRSVAVFRVQADGAAGTPTTGGGASRPKKRYGTFDGNRRAVPALAMAEGQAT